MTEDITALLITSRLDSVISAVEGKDGFYFLEKGKCSMLGLESHFITIL